MARLRTHNRRRARLAHQLATVHLVRSWSLRGWHWHQFKHLSVYRARQAAETKEGGAS